MTHIAGSSNPVVTGETIRKTSKDGCVVTVNGVNASLRTLQPAPGTGHAGCSVIPEGYLCESSEVSGDRLTINCMAIGEDSEQNPAAPFRVTYQVDMVATEYELKDHPSLVPGKSEILAWLATEDAKRYDGQNFKYADADGELQTVSNQFAEKFCKAYVAGITRFTRYFPVIRKISYYRRVPGLTMDGISVTGGSPAFSGAIGTWNHDHGLALDGFAESGWFKSGDSWQQGTDNIWTRNEEWTWAPDGSDSDHSWIYENSNDSSPST